MAAKVFRHASVYYKSKKVAMFSGWEETIESGNEDMIGDAGWEGRSAGAKMTKLSTDAIIPVAGMQVSVIRDLLNDEYVDIGLAVVDGKIHRITMGVDSANITSEAANGTLRGRFSFSGGKPELIG